MRCKPCFSSSSSLFSVSSRYKAEKTECCDPKIRMGASSVMKDIHALIPNVGSGEGRQCRRDHTTIICGEEIPAYGRYETRYAQRERERGTKRYNSISNNYNEQPTFTKGYKVTLYSDSLRATALYAVGKHVPPDGRRREPAHHRTGPDRFRPIGRTEM